MLWFQLLGVGLDRQEIGPADLYPPSPSSDNSKNPSASGRGGGRGPAKGRSNRGRTVLTEKQRTILTACFQHNPKPDALLKVNSLFSLIHKSIIQKNLFNLSILFSKFQCNKYLKLKPLLPQLGTASRNDRPKRASHKSLVSKPSLQRTQASESSCAHNQKGQSHDPHKGHASLCWPFLKI